MDCRLPDLERPLPAPDSPGSHSDSREQSHFGFHKYAVHLHLRSNSLHHACAAPNWKAASPSSRPTIFLSKNIVQPAQREGSSSFLSKIVSQHRAISSALNGHIYCLSCSARRPMKTGSSLVTFIQPEVLPRGAGHQIPSPAAQTGRHNLNKRTAPAQSRPQTQSHAKKEDSMAPSIQASMRSEPRHRRPAPVRDLMAHNAVQAAVAGQQRRRHVGAARVLLRRPLTASQLTLGCCIVTAEVTTKAALPCHHTGRTVEAAAGRRWSIRRVRRSSRLRSAHRVQMAILWLGGI